MKRYSKPLIAVIVTLIVALIAGMVSAIWIIMTPLTTETGSTFRPNNIEEKVTISFNYGEFDEIVGYPANQEAHAPIEAIAGRDVTFPTADELTKEGEPYKPAGYGLSAWESNNGVRYEPGETAKFSSDVTMTPVWAKVVTVTFISEGHENRTIDIEAGASFSDTLAYKSAAWPDDMEKTTDTGKAFSGWFDSVGVQYTNTTVFNDSVELTAKFKLTKLPKLYFGLVGDGATNAPIKVTEKLAKNASRMLFSQDKEHLYTISSSSSSSSFTATTSSTGAYTKFEREIYLYVGDHFDIIGTTEDDDSGPLFTEYTHQQRSGYVPKFYVASGGVAIGGGYRTEYKATSAGYYKITLYVPYSSRTKWDDTAYVRFDRVSTESAPATSTHQLYIRGTHNGWLNDWPWGSFDVTKVNTTYTNSAYNFNKFKAPTVSGSVYTYTYDITLKEEDLASGNFQFKAYDANVLVWLGLEDSSKGKLSPSSSTGVSKDMSSANSGNIIISEPGIWEVKIALTVSTNGTPTKWDYTVSKVSKTVTFDYGDYTGSTPPAQQVVKENTQLTLPGAPTWAGHKFLGWKANGETDADEPHQQGDTYTVTKDVTFTAQWKELKTVTYTDPEFPDRVTTHKYVEDKEVADYTAPDPATWPVGRKFAGWHTDLTLETLYTGTPITEDTTLYAKWDYIEYIVKFASAINDATLKNMPEKDAEGKPYTVSLQEEHTTLDLTKIAPPTLTGYTFAHWTYGATINLSTFTLTEDDVKGMVEGSTELTLTAQWTAITYKIVFDPNKPAKASDEVLNLDERDNVYVTREEGKDEIRLPIGYMKNDKVDYEQGVFLRGYRLKGWNLEGWLEDGSLHSPLMGTTYLDTDMIEKAVEQGGEHVITFYADWYEGTLDINVPHEHTISYSFNSYGGVVYPLDEEKSYHDYDWTQWDDKNYEHSKTASPNVNIAPAPHWAGFKFEYWDYRDYAYILGLENAKHQYNAGDIFTIDEFDGPQITFDAIWSPIEYTVNFDTNTAFLQEAGAVDPVITGFGGEPISMNRLGSVILESVNTKGFTFTGWQIDTCAANGNESTVTIAPGEAFTITTGMIAAANSGHDVDENTTLTLTAQWTKTEYGVVFLTNGHGTAPAAKTLTWGEPFTLTDIEPSAIPEDYEFLGWKLGGEGETVYGTGHTATYTMSYAEIPESDLYYIIYFVAQWKSQATTYTVTFASSINISAATMPEPLSNLAEGDTVDFTSSTIGDSALYSNDYATGSTNYRFLGWSLTQSATSGILYTTRNISTEMPTNVDFTKQTSYTIGGDTTDIVFYAIWARLYTITFDMNGGSASQAPDSQTNVYGKTYSLPSATRTDYTFNGWRQGSTSGTLRAVNFTWKFGSTATSSSVTLYASWTEKTTNVTLHFHSPWLSSRTLKAYIFNSPIGNSGSFDTASTMTNSSNGWYTKSLGSIGNTKLGSATFNLIVYGSGKDYMRVEKGNEYKYTIKGADVYVAMDGTQCDTQSAVTTYEGNQKTMTIHKNKDMNWSSIRIHVWDSSSGDYTSWDTRPTLSTSSLDKGNNYTYSVTLKNGYTVSQMKTYGHKFGVEFTNGSLQTTGNDQKIQNLEYAMDIYFDFDGTRY